MVKVSIEVRCGSVRIKSWIQAPSIRRAVSLAEGLYPASDVRVIFPIDPECFFVEGPFAKERVIATGMHQEKKKVV